MHLFSLSQPYPNPFNPITTIDFSVPIEKNVQFNVYDIKGQKIKTLVNDTFNPGYYSIDWNAEDVSSGMYFISMNAGDFHRTYKIILLK